MTDLKPSQDIWLSVGIAGYPRGTVLIRLCDTEAARKFRILTDRALPLGYRGCIFLSHGPHRMGCERPELHSSLLETPVAEDEGLTPACAGSVALSSNGFSICTGDCQV